MTTQHDHGDAHYAHHAPQTYEKAIVAFRADKDAFFRDSPDSPLLPEDKPRFTGIAYFPPDQRYRLEGLRLRPPANRLPVRIEAGEKLTPGTGGH